ncbi:uncharacterized protein L969DRAFT_87472 [Mixia osmundae IAM 14324]|uniref:CRAL-TRIO domain-containing protein n=1 Tax=Mixia osmundae (strain CBS 9802 / IAM 14324 / JCM 22182 / KY 12970) TaxID=764103 RepID=G7DVN0_MIXOS|nr:uncharacterized protein L969DRAFT_87472 [Mixia osmundae IAM 14324]KEI39515.1 hypothetical protein L969DRAFT_87472 [Mixia osmundae IAM 14324]GAA94640.1 hypothetical protein E5Q_01293 [Mixia osmundae IAM 14324]
MGGTSMNPLPTEGHIDCLKPEQRKKLREFWAQFFELLDQAPERGSVADPDAEGGGSEMKGKKDGKDAGKDIPKDDKEKERVRAEAEMKNAKAALEKYGSIRVKSAYWRFIAMDDPDVMMLRFLRARKYDVPAGVAMLMSTILWRIEGDVEKIFYKGEEGMQNAEGFLKQLASSKTYTQGTDRQGRPVVYIHVGLHKLFDQSAKALEDFVIFQMESVRLLFAPPVDKVTIVFDMTGFGLSNMDWKCVLFIVKCLEAYYPESLNTMLIHNAPWVFQGIWKILGPMLDPVVRQKIQFSKNTEEMTVIIHEDHLVKKLGGKSDWVWHYEPVQEGENAAQQDKSTQKKRQAERDNLIEEYESICRKWVEDASEVNTKIRELVTAALRVQYWALDPYIRGRGCYHRHKNVIGNGLVMFEYPGLSPEGEWDIRGYSSTREHLIGECERMKAEIKDLGGKVPKLDMGLDDDAGGDSGDEAPKRRKSVSKKPSRRGSMRERD